MTENQEGDGKGKGIGAGEERRKENRGGGGRKMGAEKIKGGGREKHYFQWTQAYIHFEAIVLLKYVDYCSS